MKKIILIFFLIFGLAMLLNLIGGKVAQDQADNKSGPNPPLLPIVQTRPMSSAGNIQRAPSSTKSLLQRGGHILVGEGAEKFQDMAVPLAMKNSIDPQWEKKLSTELYRFMPDGTEASFTKLKSYIKVKANEGRYLEEVLVTYKMPNGEISRFNAEIDPQSGRITSTWNRTRHEHVHEDGHAAKGERERFEASGVIY